MSANKAIVTGASRGIGKALSITLAKLGYNVILVSRSEKELLKAAKDIENIGSKSFIYRCDFSNLDSVSKTSQAILKEHPRIDALVNNAGIWKAGSLEQSVEEFNQVLNVNLSAQYEFLKNIVPVMKEQKSGYIFNIASRAGKYGFPGSGTYVASKFGFVGLSESLYRELAEYNIKVTAICPSWVNTDMAIEAGGAIPPEEMIQPDDISKTLEWLLSLSEPVAIKEIQIECRLRIK